MLAGDNETGRGQSDPNANRNRGSPGPPWLTAAVVPRVGTEQIEIETQLPARFDSPRLPAATPVLPSIRIDIGRASSPGRDDFSINLTTAARLASGLAPDAPSWPRRRALAISGNRIRQPVTRPEPLIKFHAEPTPESRRPERRSDERHAGRMQFCGRVLSRRTPTRGSLPQIGLVA